MNMDTIAAIATPLGTGGISIVKISGRDALAAVARIFRPNNAHRRLDDTPSQTMIYGHIYDPANGALVDEVLVTVLRGPHSFTGENVVEINCHGGPEVTSAVLDILLQTGLRHADPGEFTRRAFMNGRIDLTQVEGTIDLIQAKTRRAARLGSQMIASGLGNEIERLLTIVRELRVLVEADIDFVEDITDVPAAPAIRMRVAEELIPAVEQLVRHYHDGRILRSGMRVVLVGKPNVGKSSLMNRLLVRDRVIVTDVPGTTRDTIEEQIAIEGIPLVVCDTAGIRNSSDPIERIGQQKTQEAIAKADLLLFMMDASQPIDDVDRELWKSLDERPRLVLRNKSDLIPNVGQRSTLDEPPEGGYLDISALSGEGLERLKSRLLQAAGIDTRAEAQACLPNRRHRDLLIRSSAALGRIAAQPHDDEQLETMAIDLMDCERYLNQIMGVDVTPDVLDDIFKQFCIGK